MKSKIKIRNDDRIDVRIDPRLKDALGKIAAMQGKTMSGMVKHLIVSAVEEKKVKWIEAAES